MTWLGSLGVSRYVARRSNHNVGATRVAYMLHAQKAKRRTNQMAMVGEEGATRTLSWQELSSIILLS